MSEQPLKRAQEAIDEAKEAAENAPLAPDTAAPPADDERDDV